MISSVSAAAILFSSMFMPVGPAKPSSNRAHIAHKRPRLPDARYRSRENLAYGAQLTSRRVP